MVAKFSADVQGACPIVMEPSPCAFIGTVMNRFRFVTPHRIGKWYPDLVTAQRHACAIGAGFRQDRTGLFVAYPGTRLEVAGIAPQECRAA